MTLADIIIVLVISLIVGYIIYRMFIRHDDDLCSKCAYAKRDECSTKKKTTLN